MMQNPTIIQAYSHFYKGVFVYSTFNIIWLNWSDEEDFEEVFKVDRNNTFITYHFIDFKDYKEFINKYIHPEDERLYFNVKKKRKNTNKNKKILSVRNLYKKNWSDWDTKKNGIETKNNMMIKITAGM